jgi:ribosomal protein RSM22 (predicted rRNA methylase)
MQTHYELIYDQLELLKRLLADSTQALFKKPAGKLKSWQRDDMHTLAYNVDLFMEQYASVPQRLQDGHALHVVGGDLSALLDAARGYSEALLQTDDLSPWHTRHLEQIHNLSMDLLDIVREMFGCTEVFAH